MNKFKITLDASYNYDSFEIEAENILHLLSMVSDAYSISRITKIELVEKKCEGDSVLLKELCEGEEFFDNHKVPYILLKKFDEDKYSVQNLFNGETLELKHGNFPIFKRIKQ